MTGSWRPLITLTVLASAILIVPLLASAAQGDLPAVGQPAPDATLPDQDGNPVTLSELWTESPLVVYFYPADFTPG